jgi:hypothetical protein
MAAKAKIIKGDMDAEINIDVPVFFEISPLNIMG